MTFVPGSRLGGYEAVRFDLSLLADGGLLLKCNTWRARQLRLVINWFDELKRHSRRSSK